MKDNKPEIDDEYSLDWLGCKGCVYNVGKPDWPVCDHPNGVRLVFGHHCINHTESKWQSSSTDG